MREKLKNTMRSAEEKERIVLESYKEGRNKIANKYDIHVRVLTRWRRRYEEFGLDGLHSQTGKKSHGGGRPSKPTSRAEELELENLKLKVEVARLKKGYLVKGVGSKKEYVTIKDLNTKS